MIYDDVDVGPVAYMYIYIGPDCEKGAVIAVNLSDHCGNADVGNTNRRLGQLLQQMDHHNIFNILVPYNSHKCETSLNHSEVIPNTAFWNCCK